MKDKKLAIISIVVIAVSVVVLLFAIFGGVKTGTPAVLLPNGGSGAVAGDSSLAAVTPQTVQAVIKTLSRPDSYSRTVKTEDFCNAGGGSSSTELQVWVSGGNTRINVSRGAAKENILLGADGVTIWYDGSDKVHHSTANVRVEPEKWMRELNYEELLELPVSDITGAGYKKYAGEGCIWAEYTTPELGYRCVEYISVTTGLLMGIETYDGDTLVYRMTSGTPSITTQDAELFKAPTE